MDVVVNEKHFECSVCDAEAFLLFLCWTMHEASVVLCPLRCMKVATEVSSSVLTCNMVYTRDGQEVATGGTCQSHEKLREAAKMWFDARTSDLKDRV